MELPGALSQIPAGETTFSLRFPGNCTGTGAESYNWAAEEGRFKLPPVTFELEFRLRLRWDFVLSGSVDRVGAFTFVKGAQLGQSYEGKG